MRSRETCFSPARTNIRYVGRSSSLFGIGKTILWFNWREKEETGYRRVIKSPKEVEAKWRKVGDILV